MMKTALLGLDSSKNIFDRLVSFLERILDLNGTIAARNDEPPYFGL